MTNRLCRFIAVILFVIFVCFHITAYADDIVSGDIDMHYKKYTLKEAVLPDITQYPSNENAEENEILAMFEKWWELKERQQQIVVPSIETIHRFTGNSLTHLMADRKYTNFLYSPINLWFCLCAISGIAEGDSKTQIMSALQSASEEELIEQLFAVYDSLYWDDGLTSCLPALSLWLSTDIKIAPTLYDILAECYRVSMYQGSMRDPEFNMAFQTWINTKTKSLLNEAISAKQFDENTEMLLCTTLYLKDGWVNTFDEDDTFIGDFKTDSGLVSTDFMFASNDGAVFYGEGFSATLLDLRSGGYVAFVLPNEEKSVESLLDEEECLQFVFSGRNWDNGRYGTVNITLPKVDTIVDVPLKETLERMRIIDIFNSDTASFSKHIDSEHAISFSSIQQYSRLIMDEEGIEAASITLANTVGLMLPSETEMDFTLDRPFLYAVISDKSIPMFVGIYNTPE